MLRKTLLTSALLAFCSMANAQQANDPDALSVYLSVNWHGEDKGFPNTPDSAYSCGFDKSVYELTKAGVVGVNLVKGTEERFSIVSLRVDNDARGEYQQDRISDRKASFYGANLTQQTVYFTVFVRDSVNGQIIECDPQMTNSPIKP